MLGRPSQTSAETVEAMAAHEDLLVTVMASASGGNFEKRDALVAAILTGIANQFCEAIINELQRASDMDSMMLQARKSTDTTLDDQSALEARIAIHRRGRVVRT